MSKREKIILIVMAVVIVYGIYEFFFTSSEEATGLQEAAVLTGTTDDTPQFIARLTKKLPPKGKAVHHKLLMTKAAAPWGEDPFLSQPLEKSDDSLSSRPAMPAGGNLVYSGFIEIGKKRLAIVNGLEYAISETIQPDGYVLLAITPAEIRVGYASGNAEFVVPLEEIDSLPSGK